MRNQLVMAHLNLHAILPNLEELVEFDPEMTRLIGTWDIAIEFAVRAGPRAHVVIRNGRCKVGPGPADRPDVKLWFKSPEHLNAMFDGKAKPLPVKGFSRLGFMSSEFPKLTDRLTHYLRGSDDVLRDPRVVDFVTRCMLYTAVFGVAELAELDPAVAGLAARTPNGTAEFKILPDGPTVHVTHRNGDFTASKGPAGTPNVKMYFRDTKVCNDLLNGRMDAFAALGRGDVVITGFLPLADQLNAMLEYLEDYLK
ncbi:MAG: hypothetical protein JXQ73_12785 [Phycisphaerae bacterium]|nr:hypothetical protein [Phycisphaerae bacterium]